MISRANCSRSDENLMTAFGLSALMQNRFSSPENRGIRLTFRRMQILSPEPLTITGSRTSKNNPPQSNSRNSRRGIHLRVENIRPHRNCTSSRCSRTTGWLTHRWQNSQHSPVVQEQVLHCLAIGSFRWSCHRQTVRCPYTIDRRDLFTRRENIPVLSSSTGSIT